MSTPYDPRREPDRHDVAGGGHHRPGHGDSEGEYQDKDVTEGEEEIEAVGSYVDVDVTPDEQLQPRDEGEYTDRDDPPGLRGVDEEGEYPDVDPSEASHHRRTEGRDETHG